MAFSALTINDGLSQGLVMRIFQDRYGFMWFATLDGLNRFDGYRFVVYRHDAHDPTSITESYVQTIFEDTKGRLWIGTRSGGLDLFDRKTETFIHVKDQGAKNDPRPLGFVTSIEEDSRGQIWVQAGDQVYRITVDENKKNLATTFHFRPVMPPFRSPAFFLYSDKKRTVYNIDAYNGVVYKFNTEPTESWSVAYRLDGTPGPVTNKTPAYRISQIVEDTVSGKFCIFHEKGVTIYDAKKSKPEKELTTQIFLSQNQPLQVSLDKDGLAWFNRHDSLLSFNIRTGQLHLAKAKDLSFAWPLQNPYTTFIDRSGLLWLGTSGYGILKRNSRAEKFHHTGSSSLYTIRESGNGKILFGKDLARGKIFDRASEQLNEIRNVVKTKADADYYIDNYNLPILTDATGSWLADSIRLAHSRANGKETTYYRIPLPFNADYPDFIQTAIVDSNSHIWLGTTEGLVRFDLASKQWTVYRNQTNDPTSLSSNRIFSLCFDPVQPNRYLWIGTDGGGLNRMDLATGKCLVYRVKDGLPNDVVYGVLPDDDGNLWLSSNNGLSCFNTRQQTFRNFDYKDGLQSNEFNRRSSCRTKDGCLFFGGVNGFNYFYPREIVNNQTVPQVVITGLKIRNQDVPIQAQGSPLSAAIYLTKTITLPYDQNFISFEFAAMDFTYPEKNLYKYRLEGFEKEWINSGNAHSATYTNLDPGTYTFRVKGSNNDGIWNEKGTSITLIILPPWYMTWWFRAAIAIAVLVIIYTFYRYRLAQALKLQAIRDRIAGDLHDEVGSNLSNIYIFSNVAQQKASAGTDTAPLLQKITDYTQQSMDAMNDIVWMINTRNDRFENIMVRMRMIAAEFAEASVCSLHLDFDESLNDVKLSMEERKNFYLIYKEAINNTAKYAECKNLWVEMKLVQSTVQLTIRDNGKGFDPVATGKGNGLFSMKRRAEMLKGALTIKSIAGEGTTIQLRFKI